jgi:hypothetical protein
MGQTNKNENGQPLGRTVTFEQSDMSLSLELVSWAWVRGVFLPAWRRGLRSSPFGICWDSDSHVEDTALVTADDSFTVPHQSGKIATLSLTVSGVVT